ncbi:hypothetical protein E7939_21965 [Salmonella enterica]|nr:hypothetical protein [Salmonella enterica]
MMAILNHPDTSALDATLARHWAVQVRDKASDPWLFVQGLTGVSPNMGDKSRQDAGDMHGGNYGAQIATEANWSLELTLQRKLDATGAPDPGVELLRSKQGQLGGDELVHVRFWRTDELPDSYQGRAGVTFANAAGDKSSLTGATATLTGYQGYTTPAKPQTVAVNEVQRLAFLDPGDLPTSFKVKALAATTAALTASSLTASALQTAITGLAPIGSGNATVTGDNANGYVITFVSALAGVDVPLLQIVDIVGGAAGDVFTEVVTEGAPAA